MKLAFVGYLGHQGSAYIEAVRLLRGVEVVALVDSTLGRDERHAHQGAPIFRSTEAMLNVVVPEVAIVTLPHDQHYSVIAALVAAGSHVVVEKPLVPDAVDAERLYRLSVSSGRSIVTLTQRPLRPEFRLLEALIPQLGEIYWVQWAYNLAVPVPTSGWRAEWRHARGGVFLDMGYHQIDFLCALFGPARVVSASKRFRYQESRSEDLEDLMSVSLEFDRFDVGCNLLLARHGSDKSERLAIHGTNGVIEIDARHPRLTLFGQDGGVAEEYIGAAEVRDSSAILLGHYLELVRQHDAALSHLRHHLRLVSLCDSVYEVASR